MTKKDKMLLKLQNYEQLHQLRKEFIDFQLEEMSYDEMASYIANRMMLDYSLMDEVELNIEIDKYDDFLYDILVSYVKDEENSYEILQEYKHERHENDWIDN